MLPVAFEAHAYSSVFTVGYGLSKTSKKAQKVTCQNIAYEKLYQEW